MEEDRPFLFSDKMASSGTAADPPTPIRSVSAPAQLDPNLLFAYPVTLFARAPEGLQASYKEEQDEGVEAPVHRKMSSFSDFESDARSTSSLVKAVVDCCIGDESPRHEDLAFQNEYFASEQTYELAKDQIGCRLLQKRLEEDSPYAVQLLFNQVLPHIAELMVHPFGNYLCQKLIEIGSEQQLSELVAQSHVYLASISLNAHGTRVVQKLVEVLCRSPLILSVLTALKSQVVGLIKDANGNHVVQRCLTLLQPSFNQFIYQAVASNVVEVATHRHGCCVLQRCIDYAESEQKKMLINCVIEHAVDLVQDAYGNYAMQYILDLNHADTNARLAHIFTLQIVQLSKQKFSSNVIEKCLQQNSSEIQMTMIREIGKPHNLTAMLFDQYANYVVQRALTLAPVDLQKQLLTVSPRQEVRNNMDGLRRSQFGKRIYSKLAKKYPDLVQRYVL